MLGQRLSVAESNRQRLQSQIHEAQNQIQRWVQSLRIPCINIKVNALVWRWNGNGPCFLSVNLCVEIFVGYANCGFSSLEAERKNAVSPVLLLWFLRYTRKFFFHHLSRDICRMH